MKTADFDFSLPSELIAQRPVSPRDGARLLDARNDFADRLVRDLPGLLRPGDLVVLNDTRVIPARLTGRRRTARVEVTLHKEVGDGDWLAFARPARRLAPGDRIDFAPDFAAEVREKGADGEVRLVFDRRGGAFTAALRRHGTTPLPPYIRRPGGADPADAESYQTVYARADGAVAAPTAGLHLTPRLLTALRGRGIEAAMLTLHVGAGTFLPVKVENVAEHRLHSERGTIPEATADAVNGARSRGGRVVAVGTTTLRLLETAAGPGGTVRPFVGETDLFITPGYAFRAVDLLLTNFHLPRSTLFMLVSAFAGVERMRVAYDLAIARRYRFYSYGDCTLLERGG
ncbi:MAG: tRNA preQ1(34) S-adenosylmethionine ribosyltransferase-isomerase QueA [Proteobacteria bacterium]|nr:tRNA preQ1(34) S-adenosylmethionine ribosyltransferase-isomerase QueA [Pseudomonadota bacterium]